MESIKSNFIYNSIYQLMSIIIPLITTPYLSRTLRAEGLGQYSFSYSVALYFYLFIRLGLYSYGNRSIAYVKEDKEELSKTFCSIYAFQLLLGILVSILYYGYAIFYAYERNLALIFSLVVLAGGVDFTWLMYGLEEFKVTSLRDIGIKLFTTVCIFSFVNSVKDVWKYALIYSLGFFVSQVSLIPIVIRKINVVIPSITDILSHIKPNIILFLPTIAVSLYKIMDRIMLGYLSNDTELGLYYNCENIINVPLALINSLGTIMLPRMSSMLSNSSNAKMADDIFDKSISFAMFISTSICIGIMTVSKEFVPLFFGIGFDKCNTLFAIILPSCIFLAFANVIRTQYLLPRKRDVVYVLSLFSGAIVNLVANLVLIPRYASVGAAIGTLAAEITVCVFQSVSVLKEARIGKNILKSLPFIISGVIMFVMCHNYAPKFDNRVIGLLFKILISGGVYIAVLGVMISIRLLRNKRIYR